MTAAAKVVGTCSSCSPYAFRVYGEFLYLRARDSEVCYAVETNSNLSTPGGQTLPSIPIQTSPIAVLDQDYSSGFRAGFGIGSDACRIGASRRGRYVRREFDHHSMPFTIFEMVLYPATDFATRGGLEAAGRHDIQYDLVDIDYRSYLVQTCTSSLDYVIGVRWGSLEQAFARGTRMP